MAPYIIKNKRPRIFLFFICCVLLLGIYSISIPKQVQHIRVQLEVLTPLEREYLTNFFKVPVFKSAFGYTIFGTKPMSFDTIKMETRDIGNIDYMDIRYIFDQYRMKEGLEVWKRYTSLFPLKNFSIIFYDSPLYPKECVEVAILNHSACLQTINEHLSDFQAVLGKQISTQNILEGYLQGHGNVFETIRHHDGLFGTLLGFGRDNAWEFMRRSGGKTMQKFVELKEVLDTQDMLPPLFTVIDDSNETKKLRKQYLEERERINKIYQSPDFLEQILKKLTGQ